MREIGPVGKRGDLKYRKRARTLLGMLKARMKQAEQKQGWMRKKLADGSVIEVRSNFGHDYFRVTVPELVSAAEVIGIWVCFPSSDEAEYGWGDPYTEENAPLGTIQVGLDLTQHIGRLMSTDGTLDTHGTNLIASHYDWREDNTNVVVSWTRTSVYADGAEIHTDLGIECAALHEMQDAGQTKLFLVWVVAGTFTLKAVEVTRNPITVVGGMTYSWPCAVNYTMPSYLPADPEDPLYPDLDDEDRFRYWSFSQDGTKLNYTWTYRTSDALNGSVTICIEYISESWEASPLPSDVSSAGTDITFTKILENGPLSVSGGSTTYNYAQKFLLKGVYINSVLTGVWAELTVKRYNLGYEEVVAPLDTRGIACPSGDFSWFTGEIVWNYDRTRITHKVGFYVGAALLEEYLYSDIDIITLARHNLRGFGGYRGTGTCEEVFSPVTYPDFCPDGPDTTTLANYFTIDSNCNQLSSIEQIFNGVVTFNNYSIALSCDWVGIGHRGFVKFGDAAGGVVSPDLSFINNGVTYSLGTDFGASGPTRITGAHPNGSQEVFYMNSNARHIIRHPRGGFDLISDYKVDGHFLDVGDNLAFCCGSESDSTALWSWLSYFDDQTTQQDLVPLIEISGYTNPKIIIDQANPPVTFGLIQQVSEQ